MNLRNASFLAAWGLLGGCPADSASDDGGTTGGGVDSTGSTQSGPVPTSGGPGATDTGASSGSGDGSGSDGSTGPDGSTGSAGSTGSDGSTGSSGSTGNAAVCGDGIPNGDEACDDANEVAGDGCEADCSLSINYVFVSSTLLSGNLGGLAGADATCNQLASDAGLPGTYVAYLSTATVDARDRLGSARGWIRPDGRAFADTVDDVLDAPWYPAVIDENGTPVEDDRAYSATDSNGVFNAATTSCGDWMSPSGATTGGFPSYAGWRWAGHTPSTYSCGLANYHIYCFGIDHANPVAVQPATGRTAFVSHTGWTPGGGLAAADAVCQTEADDAGLAGTYLALLSTEASAATDRFDLTGDAWVRPDGVALVETAGDLAGGPLLAPFFVGPDGVSEPNAAWTGASDPDAPAPAGACGDWTQTSGASARGSQEATIHAIPGSSWFGMWATNCTSSGRLYCLEL